MDRELYRNASGYIDPTAYNAMITMEEFTMEIRPFEIWEYDITTGKKMGVALAQEAGSVAFLALHDKEIPGGMDIMTIEGPKFLHPVRMAYIADRRLTRYVQDVTEQDVKDIKQFILAVYDQVIPDVKEVVRDNSGDVEGIRAELAAEKREKDVYKGLYEGLLDRLISR